MKFIEIILIAFGLSADAFAVAVAVGAGGHARDLRSMFRLSWYFGFFQFMMPVLGWFSGFLVSQWIRQFDHWIAFLLLAFVGLRMLYASFHPEEIHLRKNPTKGYPLILLSVATSIDALVIGLSLAFMNISIWYPSFVIGIVTALVSFLGIRLGKRFNRILGRAAEVLGGIVLIGLGFRMLLAGV
jgi:putative Mn2+ efflux pump MntP